VSQAQSIAPRENNERVGTNATVSRREVVTIEDDEFGDVDFDGDELIAAEAAATQAFQGSYVAQASVGSDFNLSCR
jgi:hypothetical protein